MKDTFMIIMSVIGFIILLSLDVNPLWAIVILLFALMVYISVQYPNGLSDWDKNRKETAALLLTIVSILLLVFLIYIALSTITLPSSMLLMSWISAIIFAFLFIISLFYPAGRKSNTT
ncbi:MAG: hypothetical protein R6U61_05605 [Thermoplasmata archaeon]